VLLQDKGIICWGGNDRGQLGLGDLQSRATPAAALIDLGTGRSALDLTVGGGFACALLDTMQAKCWGENGTYQLGALLKGPAYGDQPNEMGDFLAAALQGGGRSVRDIVAGRAHACAILDTRDVRCWGDNSHGQLGAGDAQPHSVFLAPNSVVDLGGGR
jgi:alpha-tubulin suppressor-like RCC1 family protein